MLRGLVSLWRHELRLALILLAVVAVVMVVLRNVAFFILMVLMFIAVNSGITVVVEGRWDSLIALVISLFLIFLMVRREMRRRGPLDF